MENEALENKKKNVVLTDEELKDVAGGAKRVTMLDKICEEYKTETECEKDRRCIWSSFGKCIVN